MKDNIDNWFFNKLIKGIIDALIVLLKLVRPDDNKPLPQPDDPSPIIPLPKKPVFPWLRKHIDNIFNKEKV